MTRVSLIALTDPNCADSLARLASFRHLLEEHGYAVVVEPIAPSAIELAMRAIEGLRVASGDLLVVIDMAMAYSAADLLAVVAELESGPACLVIAARRSRRFGTSARRIFGTTDPSSGLVGVTREAARAANGRFAPVGTRFVCELLARVEGERADVLVDALHSPRRRWVPLDDVRHAKRIADERLGTISRLLQFCFVGASGMVVDLTTYAALLAVLARTPLHDHSLFRVVGGNSITLAEAFAGLLAIATAIVWNFSLNRRLTFSYARRESIVHQFSRYLLSNLAGCAVSLAFRLLLPSRIPFFARHRLAAAVTGIIAATGISFTLARWFVFTNRSHRAAAATAGLVDSDSPVETLKIARAGSRPEAVALITGSAAQSK